MRKALNESARDFSRPKSIPAPTGGWNTMESMAAMKPTDAVFLDNFFPQTTDVMLRKGSQQHATVTAGQEIRTLMGYKAPSGAAKLFAAGNDGIFDVTAGGAGTISKAATNAEWQHTNVATAGGAFLWACNGTDSLAVWDGTKWLAVASTSTAQTISSITAAGTIATMTTAAPHGLVTGDSITVSGATPAAFNGTFTVTVTSPTTLTYTMLSAPGGNATVVGSYIVGLSFTGLSQPDVVNVSLFKTRLILCRKNSLSFYYLPNNAIAGAATEFPLGALFRKGGYLMATETWTRDAGNGPDDYFVAITSEGEVALYQGTDPSLSTAFSLVGIFQLPAPLTRRCFVKIEGELCVLTKAGLLPLSKALPAEDKKEVAMSRKIERAFMDYAAKFSTNYGWQPVYFPEASMLLVNVPLLRNHERNVMYSYQFVMNTMTGAWCRFLNLNSECWLAFDGKLYFALNDKVYQAWTGTSDRGGVVDARAKTAFSLLNSSRSKHVKMVRPLITADASVSLQLAIDVDFNDTRFAVSIASFTQSVSRWDEDTWNVAKWNGSPSVLSQWRTLACKPGRTAATRLRVVAKDVTMTWIATDLILADGGML